MKLIRELFSNFKFTRYMPTSSLLPPPQPREISPTIPHPDKGKPNYDKEEMAFCRHILRTTILPDTIVPDPDAAPTPRDASSATQSTHAAQCWAWGPRHYECALERIRVIEGGRARGEILGYRIEAKGQPACHHFSDDDFCYSDEIAIPLYAAPPPHHAGEATAASEAQGTLLDTDGICPDCGCEPCQCEDAAPPTAAQERKAVALTFDAFREANVTRCVKWHAAGINSWSSSDWLTAVTGELGELASLIKMRNRERDGLPGNKFSPSEKQVADEIADVLTYLDLLAASLGVNLGTAAVSKFNEVSERVGFPDRIELRTNPVNIGGAGDDAIRRACAAYDPIAFPHGQDCASFAGMKAAIEAANGQKAMGKARTASSVEHGVANEGEAAQGDGARTASDVKRGVAK